MRVAEILRARGARVFTPTLAGLGERVHLASAEITLSTHVGDIVKLLVDEDLHDVILCGHSYGGFVISGVVEAVPERIRALVFLDAFVPDDGQSLLDLTTPANRERHRKAVSENGGFLPPIPAAAFAVNEADRAYVDMHCVPQPAATFSERVVLTGARERVGHKTYVRASGYGSPPFDAARDRASLAGWVVEDIPCGHDAMLDLPVELAGMLLAAAARAGS